jgi:hypothetical protein
MLYQLSYASFGLLLEGEVSESLAGLEGARLQSLD